MVTRMKTGNIIPVLQYILAHKIYCAKNVLGFYTKIQMQFKSNTAYKSCVSQNSNTKIVVRIQTRNWYTQLWTVVGKELQLNIASTFNKTMLQ